MNLAELRQKARQEQAEDATTPPFAPLVEEVSALDFDPPVDADHFFTDLQPQPPGMEVAICSAVEPMTVQESFREDVDATGNSVAPSPESAKEACPPVEEEPTVPRSSIPSKGFDPLSILLSGREAARSDDPEIAETKAYAPTDEYQEFLCFRVSTEVYAINILAVKEIIKPREVTEVPRAPEFVSGILSLRGIIIPVFHMGRRLGLPDPGGSPRQRIVVVKKGDEFFGLTVDEVIQVARISGQHLEKPPAVLEGIDRDFVSGIGRHNNDMLIVLNQEKILDLGLS